MVMMAKIRDIVAASLFVPRPPYNDAIVLFPTT